MQSPPAREHRAPTVPPAPNMPPMMLLQQQQPHLQQQQQRHPQTPIWRQHEGQQHQQPGPHSQSHSQSTTGHNYQSHPLQSQTTQHQSPQQQRRPSQDNPPMMSYYQQHPNPPMTQSGYRQESPATMQQHQQAKNGHHEAARMQHQQQQHMQERQPKSMQHQQQQYMQERSPKMMHQSMQQPMHQPMQHQQQQYMQERQPKSMQQPMQHQQQQYMQERSPKSMHQSMQQPMHQPMQQQQYMQERQPKSMQHQMMSIPTRMQTSGPPPVVMPPLYETGMSDAGSSYYRGGHGTAGSYAVSRAPSTIQNGEDRMDARSGYSMPQSAREASIPATVPPQHRMTESSVSEFPPPPPEAYSRSESRAESFYGRGGTSIASGDYGHLGKAKPAPSDYSVLSVSSRIRRMQIPSKNSDVDKFLDAVFEQVLQPHDTPYDDVFDSKSIAASIKGGDRPVDISSPPPMQMTQSFAMGNGQQMGQQQPFQYVS
uniref:Uncharacterized protein n=1 Tax=Plectus sambesii TaxID=2011161 RepID=A0A914UVF5_9BILA